MEDLWLEAKLRLQANGASRRVERQRKGRDADDTDANTARYSRMIYTYFRGGSRSGRERAPRCGTLRRGSPKADRVP